MINANIPMGITMAEEQTSAPPQDITMGKVKKALNEIADELQKAKEQGKGKGSPSFLHALSTLATFAKDCGDGLPADMFFGSMASVAADLGEDTADFDSIVTMVRERTSSGSTAVVF